ncbi:MAG: hypothetical protein ACNA8W_13710, partial [Bradymonadaceae bacterium]
LRDFTPAHNTILVGIAALIGLGAPIIETATIHPHQGSYYNAFAGRLPGAIERGYPMHPTPGLSLATVETSLEQGCEDRPAPCRLFVGEWEAWLNEYVAVGQLDGARLTETIDEADLVLRRVAEFAPRKEDTAKRAVSTTTIGFKPQLLQGASVPSFILEIRETSEDAP